MEATLKTWKWTFRAHRHAWILEGGCESRLSGLWGLLLYLWPWQFSKLNFQSDQCSARVQLRYLFIVGKPKGNRAMGGLGESWVCPLEWELWGTDASGVELLCLLVVLQHPLLERLTGI